ncbi:MAG TPA: hypothetical protein PKJ45_10370 [Rubrivivax sp.]|nr:hypothetical protein [Rubrivivax sp.]
MHSHRLEAHSRLPQRRSADAEERGGPSGTGVVLAVLGVLSLWALLAVLGV